MAHKANVKPPVMRDELSYEDWKIDVNIWSDITDLPKEKQGGMVYLSLVGKAQATVRGNVSQAEMRTADGLELILKSLDALYLEDAARSAFTAYEHFTEFRRSPDMSIDNFLVEFNIRYSKVKSLKMVLPDEVIPYYLLKCANLTKEQSNICKATCDTLNFEQMRKKIERVTSDSKKTVECGESQFYGEAEYYEHGADEYNDGEYGEYYDHGAMPEQDADQEEKAYYTPLSFRGGRRPYRHPNSTGNAPRVNAPDEYGNPSRCGFCKSIYHYVAGCPDAKRSQSSNSRGGAGGRRGMAGYRGRTQRGARGYNNYI